MTDFFKTSNGDLGNQYCYAKGYFVNVMYNLHFHFISQSHELSRGEQSPTSPKVFDWMNFFFHIINCLCSEKAWAKAVTKYMEHELTVDASKT